MMRAAFWIGASSPMGAAIRLLKRTGITHAELLFADGLAGTALAGPGVVLRPLDGSPADWLMLDLPGADEAAARALFERERGAAYDWTGIMLAQLLPWGRQHPSRWFCSEICAAACIAAGALPADAVPHRLAPHRLWRELAGRFSRSESVL